MEKGNRQVVVSALQFACTDDVPTNLATVESCSLETLSTLKFAQLAKFIKNNAVVNEDASGDVVAMRLQIQQLKLMDINESPLNVLLNPAINPTQKDLPVTIYESVLGSFNNLYSSSLFFGTWKLAI
ncbi:kinesin-like protein KIN-12C isoform X2 [Gossypium hirsutum]|uniref:Kinesin-like protein KIN-12C isoform X2 n=1 Tax=Gossypium hirsutum TaxID=3635 RepID=A0ABM3BES4_GOSHI|nr:kinesin-like protein KIN-12C isoform X2 [Gossypium hirsutum]XP_040965558.1 kinesin-like protein KIN-12C isoform X2 [Gossypium hirsutum]